jgi:hypothetical protein
MYCRHLNAHGLAIRLSPSHSLAGLLDRCQNGIVGKRRFGGDIGSLGLEVDVEVLNA